MHGRGSSDSRLVDDPAVSVIIPTFRREVTLVSAVRSVLGQANVTLEVIILDDAPEGSAAAAVLALGDSRVRYVKREKPSGGRPAVVRNEGITLARGRHLHFLDDDDLLEDGALGALASALDRAPDVGVAIGTVAPFGDDAVVLARQEAYFAGASKTLRAARSRVSLLAAMLFDATPLVNSSCMVRRSCALSVHGYATDVPRCEDVDFYLRAIRRSGHVFVDRPVVRYRTGAPSLMHSLADDSPLLRQSYGTIHRRYRLDHGTAEFIALKALAKYRRWRAGRARPETVPSSAAVHAARVS